MEICSNLIKPCLAYETVGKWIFKFLAGFRVQFSCFHFILFMTSWMPYFTLLHEHKKKKKENKSIFIQKLFPFSRVSCFCRVLPICLFMIKKSVAFSLLFLAAVQIDVNSQWKWLKMEKFRNKLSGEFNPWIRSLIDVGRDNSRGRHCWTMRNLWKTIPACFIIPRIKIEFFPTRT